MVQRGLYVPYDSALFGCREAFELGPDSSPSLSSPVWDVVVDLDVDEDGGKREVLPAFVAKGYVP